MPQYIDRVGTFICRVVKPESGWFGESKEKKTPFLRIPLQVDDPSSDQNGRTITCEKFITEATIDRLTKDLVEVFGWDGDLFALDSGPDNVPDGFAGMQCSIVTESESYDGKDRIRVQWLNSVDYKPQQLAADKVKSILSRFGSRTKAIAKSVNATAPAKPQQKVDAPF